MDNSLPWSSIQNFQNKSHDLIPLCHFWALPVYFQAYKLSQDGSKPKQSQRPIATLLGCNTKSRLLCARLKVRDDTHRNSVRILVVSLKHIYFE